jgi:hypothetical protein
MDKINFANPHTPYQEIMLARWYTISCILIAIMIIGLSAASFMQWRRYQGALQIQKSYLTHDALIQEHADLQMQSASGRSVKNNPSTTKLQLTALSQNLGKEMRLIECVLAADGTHSLTLTAPSRQKAQEYIAALNQKKLFGRLAIASLKTIQQGEKSHLLVMIKAVPSSNLR